METLERYNPKSKSVWQRLKVKCFRVLRLYYGPHLKTYPGFGNGKHFSICGHALRLSPYNRKRYRNNILVNALSLIRLFMIKPLPGYSVVMSFEGKSYKTESKEDGFFEFDWVLKNIQQAGVYNCVFQLYRDENQSALLSEVQQKLIVPNARERSFISDIDDTFLISHSSSLRKRLYVLLTENAHSRSSFENVVEHYQLLNGNNTGDPNHHSFFYVSSSEWNLFEYISDFITENDLPAGVMLLNRMKTFSQLFKTGQNNHHGKFRRIEKILKMYPAQKFVLLGDDTQQDMNIYTEIVKHYPHQIFKVYLRQVGKVEKESVLELAEILANNAVLFCYFDHSGKAIEHSIKTGLIK